MQQKKNRRVIAAGLEKRNQLGGAARRKRYGMKVNGNIKGIRDTLLAEMAGLYEVRVEGFASYELLERLGAYTGRLGREICVHITRDGRIVDVSVGDANTVSFPQLRTVRNEDRLSGVRCIHTHPSGDGQLSDVDIGTLRGSRLDAMCALGVREGVPAGFYAGFLGDAAGNDPSGVCVYGPLPPDDLPQEALLAAIREADARMKRTTRDVLEHQGERAALVGVDAQEELLLELAELARTAGAQVVAMETQKRKAMDAHTYIGQGKARELSLLASARNVDLFIFDDELSVTQQRNLETILGCKVIDRTALILDIFAMRAASREGKLQVELAQMRYRLPRLIGEGTALSRLGGGIGTRGPGEKKLETDRRVIRRRIYELEQELAEIQKQRRLRRTRREKNEMPVVALLGYTNAGKSTLLGALSGSDVFAEDKLFATLDPMTRSVELPGGTRALLTDTVGFIRKLPHELVDAFRSTLEEAMTADLILHVIDASSPYFDTQKQVAEDVILSLGGGEIPRLNVYNQMDKVGRFSAFSGEYAAISAKTGAGLDALRGGMEAILNRAQTTVTLTVPYAKFEALAYIRENGRVLAETHEADGAHVTAALAPSCLGRLRKMLQ